MTLEFFPNLLYQSGLWSTTLIAQASEEENPNHECKQGLLSPLRPNPVETKRPLISCHENPCSMAENFDSLLAVLKLMCISKNFGMNT